MKIFGPDITVTHFFVGTLPIEAADPIWEQLWVFIGTSYVFKFSIAVLDTLPFYLGTRWLTRYLELEGVSAEG